MKERNVPSFPTSNQQRPEILDLTLLPLLVDFEMTNNFTQTFLFFFSDFQRWPMTLTHEFPFWFPELCFLEERILRCKSPPCYSHYKRPYIPQVLQYGPQYNVTAVDLWSLDLIEADYTLNSRQANKTVWQVGTSLHCDGVRGRKKEREI